MSTMNLPPEIFQQFFDDNGAPLAGGSLYTYQAGTTTPQATYTDQGGGTANANPIVLDASGRCAMWLDPSLSYKFVLKDSGGTTIKTVDNVVGLLSDNSVPTAAIQDGAVTSAKLAAGAVDSTALKSDSSIDANRPVNTNNIRDSAVIHTKISSTQGFIPPVVQKFTSGSGTYNKTYVFLVSSANATDGDTYTNNGNTYTVVGTISSGSLLKATGAAAPQTSGTLTRATGTGDATIAFTAYVAPLYIVVEALGGGGGGGGSGTSGQANTAGTDGSDTTFGTSLITASGGSGSGAAASAGGAGGSVTINSPAVPLFAVSGGSGGGGTYFGYGAGSPGGNSALGGSGGGGGLSNVGYAAATNSGSGGGGGGSTNNGTGHYSGGGGGAGGYGEALITSPDATYGYAVGAGGAGSTAGDHVGGDGGSGLIIVKEYYQ